MGIETGTLAEGMVVEEIATRAAVVVEGAEEGIKATTLTMTARRGMIVVAEVEEVDVVDIVVVVEAEGDIRGTGRAITLMTIARSLLGSDVVWSGYGKWDDWDMSFVQ